MKFRIKLTYRDGSHTLQTREAKNLRSMLWNVSVMVEVIEAGSKLIGVEVLDD